MRFRSRVMAWIVRVISVTPERQSRLMARFRVLEAYSPLGTGKHLRNGTVAEIAERARPHPRAGAAPLVPAARRAGHP